MEGLSGRSEETKLDGFIGKKILRVFKPYEDAWFLLKTKDTIKKFGMFFHALVSQKKRQRENRNGRGKSRQ